MQIKKGFKQLLAEANAEIQTLTPQDAVWGYSLSPKRLSLGRRLTVTKKMRSVSRKR